MLRLLLSLASAGHAEDADPDEPRVPGELEVDGSFDTAWWELDNLDFRALDESADQRVLDSDDRSSFAYTGATIGLGFTVDPHVALAFRASHRGVWGSDQIGTVNRYGGFLYIPELNASFFLGKGERAPSFTVGRQRFELGGLGGARDYVLDDTLDMVRFDWPVGDLGRIVLVPVNVLSRVSLEDDADLLSLMGSGTEQTFNMRGDVLTRRHGFALQAESLGPVDATFYTFYTRIAAIQGGTGTDRSYHGLLGNFSDEDWAVNGGIRASAALGPVTPYLHLDGSNGIDRKEQVVTDVDLYGIAWGAGASLHTGDDTDEDEDGVRAEASYFDCWGPAYAANGQQFSHGYVSMKGDQVGGALFDTLMGFHPTAYVSQTGVVDAPHDQSRKSGTRVLHASAGYELPGFLGFSGSWWYLQDTGITELDLAKLDTITPPFGYARAEFAAQERMGRVVGQEVDLDVRFEATDHADFRLNGATILPGPYYGVVVARAAGSPGGDTALGQVDPEQPWSVSAGTTVTF